MDSKDESEGPPELRSTGSIGREDPENSLTDPAGTTERGPSPFPTGWEKLVRCAMRGSVAKASGTSANQPVSKASKTISKDKRRPTPSWAQQDLSLVSGLIASHLAPSSAEQGRAVAATTRESDDVQARAVDDRVAVVVDELALTLAEGALSNLST